MIPLKHPATRRTITEEAQELAEQINIKADWRTEDVAKAIEAAIKRYAAPKWL